MKNKYISQNRYKKVSSSGRKKRSENIAKKMRKDDSNEILKPIEKVVKKENKRRKKSNNTITKILVVCALLLLLCALRLVLKEENESFFNIFGVKVEEETIEKLDIAVVDNVNVLDNNSNNVIFTELNSYTSGVLLRITDKYEVKYELLDSVEKHSNLEYILNISKENSLTASILKSRLNLYRDSTSKYYSNCKNIQEVEELNTKAVKVTLKEEAPLFIYNLQLPVSFATSNSGIYNANTTRVSTNKITYILKEDIKTRAPKSISLTMLKNDDEAVEMFRNGSINMFFTDSYDISEKLGKIEVDIRSYLNGKCLFLLGNKESDLFSKKEIRQAIAYSIDREKIRKDVYLNSGAIIDIPEIYSEAKYKYDIYDAQNLLLASGYTMQNSKLVKDGKILELTLLVNKADEAKVNVGTHIKQDLENVGIKVNLKLLTNSELERQVNLSNYDLVLADVSLNENPDISFIEKYINVSDSVDAKIKDIKNTDNVENIAEKANELISIMSDEVVCIGIHADATYMVSNKGMNIFSDIKYMNVFTKLLLTN